MAGFAPSSSWRSRRRARLVGVVLVALLGAGALGGCVGDPGRNDKEYQQRQEREREQRRQQRLEQQQATSTSTTAATTPSSPPPTVIGGGA